MVCMKLPCNASRTESPACPSLSGVVLSRYPIVRATARYLAICVSYRNVSTKDGLHEPRDAMKGADGSAAVSSRRSDGQRRSFRTLLRG
jgi:hypothetical protein